MALCILGQVPPLPPWLAAGHSLFICVELRSPGERLPSGRVHFDPTHDFMSQLLHGPLSGKCPGFIHDQL